MAFTLFYIMETALLIANAIAILNERFLKQSKFSIIMIMQKTQHTITLVLYFSPFIVGFHVDQMSIAAPNAKDNNDQTQQPDGSNGQQAQTID